jgi:hypothetical protein
MTSLSSARSTLIDMFCAPLSYVLTQLLVKTQVLASAGTYMDSGMA